MHRNENKSDQLVRDRLKDHSLPVRADLWSRIYSGLKIRKAVRPSRYHLIKAALQNWHFSTTTLTAGAAGMLAITLGLIYFTHRTTPRPTQPIPPSTAKAPATSTRFDSVTHTTPVSTKSETPATTTTKRKTPSEAATNATATNAAIATNATSSATAANTTHVPPTTQTTTTSTNNTSTNTTNANTTATVIHRKHGGSNNPIASTNLAHRDAPANPTHHSKSANQAHGDASAVSATTRETVSTGAGTTPTRTSGHPTIQRHTPDRLTLSAIAGTNTPATITARPPVAQSRLATHLGMNGNNVNGSNVSGNNGRKSRNPANAAPFKRGVYVSLYASPDFPNHYYTWSYTVGFRASLQFSPRWSFTAGLEYARVNVPTQVVPPVGYGDTLHAFYFSNYEVPILFGYKSTFGRSELTINGGAILNLYFHQSTGVWTFNWPDRASYGAVLGVDYSWSLNRRLALFGQPYGRYSISNNRSFIPAQRLSFGTLLGIRYRLF